jgi:hypothetical protein
LESNHHLLESLHERLEALDERLSAEQNALSRALAAGLNDAYQKLFVVLENCFVIDVELLLLLRISMAKRDPATAREAREMARDFIQKKYLQFGLKPPKNPAAEPGA